MDLRRFVLFTFLGASIWNTALVSAGFLLGKYWIELAQSMDGWDIVILVIAGAALLGYIAYGRWKNKVAPSCEERR
jgi:membrane protein DedA with SNARE-associated domain